MTRRSPVRFIALALTALALSLAAQLDVTSPALAYRRGVSNWNPGSLPISYRVNEGSAPPSIGAAGARSAIDAGFATWAAPACTTWRATNAGVSTIARPRLGDRENSLAWLSGSWPAELGDVDVTIGVTTPTWIVGGFFTEADIVFNNVGFVWSMDGRGGTVDTQSIATHEQGHFLSLGHSSTSSAVMFSSYSGGLKRTLATDDVNGVCAIYPSGAATPDAGMTMTTDPCGGSSSCAGCTPTAGCGWCSGEGTCRSGTASGATGGGACTGWVWDPRSCGGTTTDPCNGSTTCSTCTPVDGCGWCGASSRCVSGTATGPVSGSCTSGYAWLPTECTDPGGTASFGEPCRRTTDCDTGGPCVTDGISAFCSRVCTEDCGCPRGYHCVPTRDPDLRVCAPGDNTCPMTEPPDAGGPPPGVDGGSIIAPGTDGGTTPGIDGAVDPGGGRRRSSGCGCKVAGTGGPGEGLGISGLAVGIAMISLVVSRRRRR